MIRDEDRTTIQLRCGDCSFAWNGMVDLAFTITGDAETAYQVMFTEKDVVGGTNLVMRTVTVGEATSSSLQNKEGSSLTSGEDAASPLDKDVANSFRSDGDVASPIVASPLALRPGTYHAVWNAGADLPDGAELERVTITVEAK